MRAEKRGTRGRGSDARFSQELRLARRPSLTLAVAGAGAALRSACCGMSHTGTFRPYSCRFRIPARAQPSLLQFVLLSMLLHMLVILLFGNARSAAARVAATAGGSAAT